MSEEPYSQLYSPRGCSQGGAKQAKTPLQATPPMTEGNEDWKAGGGRGGQWGRMRSGGWGTVVQRGRGRGSLDFRLDKAVSRRLRAEADLASWWAAGVWDCGETSAAGSKDRGPPLQSIKPFFLAAAKACSTAKRRHLLKGYVCVRGACLGHCSGGPEGGGVSFHPGHPCPGHTRDCFTMPPPPLDTHTDTRPPCARPHPHVLLRSPRSTNPGWMHACGHDAHMAMLLGATKILKELDEATPGILGGSVALLFQPNEEFGAGAEKVMQGGGCQGCRGLWVRGWGGWWVCSPVCDR